MAGISSKAATTLENRYKFNEGTELTSDFDLNWYETPFRGYDAQIGRFWQIDAMADDYENWSPYNFSLNNPLIFNDPTGLEPECPDCPEGKMAETQELPEVIVVGSKRNLWGYTNWSFFVDANKNSNQGELRKYLSDHGVNDNGLRLFDLAWSTIGMREKRAEIDAAEKEFVQEALKEGVTWLAGGAVLKIGGKAISLGYRAYKLSRNASKFFKGAKYSEKVLKQMDKVDDIYHSFPKSVDAYASKYGQWSTKVGADGKAYQWLEMPGSYGGKTGVFEYIKDASGLINHRFFNVNGSVIPR